MECSHERWKCDISFRTKPRFLANLILLQLLGLFCKVLNLPFYRIDLLLQTPSTFPHEFDKVHRFENSHLRIFELLVGTHRPVLFVSERDPDRAVSPRRISWILSMLSEKYKESFKIDRIIPSSGLYRFCKSTKNWFFGQFQTEQIAFAGFPSWSQWRQLSKTREDSAVV